MAQRELVSANRDPLLEFSDTMAQWYRCLQTGRTEQPDVKTRPPDSSPYWIIHVIDGSGPAPAAGRLKRAGIGLSELSECAHGVDIYLYRGLFMAQSCSCKKSNLILCS